MDGSWMALTIFYERCSDKSFTFISMSKSRKFPPRFIVFVTLKLSFVHFAGNSLWKSSNWVHTQKVLLDRRLCAEQTETFRDFSSTSATKVAFFPCRHHNSCLILFYWHLRQPLINASAFIPCHHSKSLQDFYTFFARIF